LWSHHEQQQAEYWMHAWKGHYGRIDIVFPLHLQQDVPSFSIWLQAHVKGQLDVGVLLDPNMVRLSQPPAHNVYESMWVHENHYCVDMESRPTHLTYDFGVACIFRQASHSSTKDENMVMENFNYVGVVKEIFVVDYSRLLLVLFKCSWILANTWGNATIL
jgi:hypothetical protein